MKKSSLLSTFISFSVSEPSVIDMLGGADKSPFDLALISLTLTLSDRRMAISRFIIEFGDRLDGHF